MVWILRSALACAPLLLKLIPAVGYAPWLCALIDAVFLYFLLRAVSRKEYKTACLAAVLMPLLDWTQGAIQGFWVAFIAAGFLLAVHFWSVPDMRPASRAVLSLLSVYLLRMTGIALGYVLLKDMRLLAAIKTVVRNGWFVFAWYALAVGCALLVEGHLSKIRANRNAG